MLVTTGSLNNFGISWNWALLEILFKVTKTPKINEVHIFLFHVLF